MGRSESGDVPYFQVRGILSHSCCRKSVTLTIQISICYLDFDWQNLVAGRAVPSSEIIIHVEAEFDLNI
jgi:hypothetical protein